LAKSIFTSGFPEYWLFALGALFVATTLFLPKGVVGTITQFLVGARSRKKRMRWSRPTSDKAAAKAESQLATLKPQAAE
jgi:urea transport system permease protein